MNRRGLTLIEVVIASALLAVLMTTVYGFVSYVYDSINRSNKVLINNEEIFYLYKYVLNNVRESNILIPHNYSHSTTIVFVQKDGTETTIRPSSTHPIVFRREDGVLLITTIEDDQVYALPL